jgi:hypothetical protein
MTRRGPRRYCKCGHIAGIHGKDGCMEGLSGRDHYEQCPCEIFEEGETPIQNKTIESQASIECKQRYHGRAYRRMPPQQIPLLVNTNELTILNIGLSKVAAGPTIDDNELHTAFKTITEKVLEGKQKIRMLEGWMI